MLAAAACSASSVEQGVSDENLTAEASPTKLDFDFSRGDAQGFVPVFRDLPKDIYDAYVARAAAGTLGTVAPLHEGAGTYPEDASHWLLNAGIHPMPDGIPGKGFLLQGNNHSDDLDMHLARKLGPKDGLRARGHYKFRVSVSLAGNAVVGSIGIGGGETLKLFANVQHTDPTSYVVDDVQHVRALPAPEVTSQNVAGVGTNGACYSKSVGNFMPPGTELCPAAPIPFRLKAPTAPVEIDAVADDQGEIWLVIGGHSGFESFSAIFYSRVTVEVSPVP
jgi:hypothetical protein